MNEGQRLLYVARVMVGSRCRNSVPVLRFRQSPGRSVWLSLPICPMTVAPYTSSFPALPFLSFSIHSDWGRGREKQVPRQPSGTSRPPLCPGSGSQLGRRGLSGFSCRWIEVDEEPTWDPPAARRRGRVLGWMGGH